jgi:TolB-like protein/DNA-binding winged helix-turn-helix (wHTH) protein/Flp pilus assembly protein TadD
MSEEFFKHFLALKNHALTGDEARHILLDTIGSRRSMAGQSPALLKIGDWIADPGIDTLTRAGQTQKLEPRAMRLLLMLAQSPGNVISVEQMLNQVWSGVIVGPASVYQAISQLRRMLGDTDPEPTYIATVPRKGYRLIAPVHPVSPAPPLAASPQPAPPSPVAALPAPIPASLPSAALHAPADGARSPRRSPRGRTAAWVMGTGVALAALALLGWLGWARYGSGAAASLPSIVVLPFIDMTEGKQDQSFCDGLTEELSNWLAQIPTLRVVARTSAFAYRDRAVDVRTIGRELGTTHVLEGSLRRSGKQLRITAQLVSTRDGYHLWSANFDRSIDDVVRVQEEIARSVADNLEIRLSAQTGRGFAARRGGTPQAYQLYLLARHHQQQLTRDANDLAIELYQQALGLDPNFSLAYAGLAYAYLNQRYLNGVSVVQIADKAEPLLAAALRLDPQLPETFSARGALRSDQGRNEEALRDLRHAIELNPNDSQALSEMGYLAGYNARPRDALASYEAAVTLDPLNFNLHARRCIELTDMARFEEAELACVRARELAPGASWAFVASSWLEWARGRIDEALRWNQLALRASPNQFDLYTDRQELLLTLGLTGEARSTLVQAAPAAANAEAVAVRLAQISYYEGGAPALTAALNAGGFAASSHADTLMLAARLELLANAPGAAKALLAKALVAPDLDQSSLDHPWRQRQGESSELTMAIAELNTGDRPAALRRLDALGSTLDGLRLAGVERYGVYQLRAQLLAVRGDLDGAMSALRHAAALGWRQSLQAAHDPALSSLQSRADFRALLEHINQGNLLMRARLAPPGG